MSKCTTATLSAPKAQQMADFVVAHWEEIEQVLPNDLAESARRSGAMQRHRRIKEPSVLLRMVLLYALGFSLRLVGAWGVLQKVVDISAVGIRNRLRQCHPWLGMLLGQMLQVQRLRLPSQAGIRLRLVDATTVQEPGSHGTDWRVHLSLDLGSGNITDVAATDVHGGESLARFAGQAGEISVADRGYAFASSLGPSLVNGEPVVVRSGWHNQPWQTAEGQHFDVIPWLKQACTSATPTLETEIWLPTPQGRFPLRLVVGVLPQEAADRARQRARTIAQKKSRTVSEATLYVCGFILLLTNLPATSWAAVSVLALYRLRWQVEVLFHRWKGLLTFEDLRAHDAELVQSCLLGKLLLVLLCDALLHRVMTQVPDWFTTCERPVSPWRLTALAYQQVCQAVLGPISWADLLTKLPQLQRFLCDTPRRRRQQLATARAYLVRLSAVNLLMLS